MKRELTCIICPRGCSLSVNIDGEKTCVSGNACPKGEKYAVEECIHPTRTVTSIVRVENRENTMVSVKTASPVPKENIFDVMEIIRKTSVKAPIKIGDIILTNIFGTDIIITKDIV
ncbi:MAG: DUF1667 domain-containing protein [Acutalibacteraceae bacterium]|nr:DUF1667 domain-containing protein [Acutalibacteraceae bacterium]